MKNTLFLAIAALCFSATVSAQSTVDSIRAKYQLVPMPEPLTLEKTFPVIGSYQLANAQQSASVTTEVQPANISITLDTANKGIIWVEGLPQGKFKAYLKKSPATYWILAQKTESGKQIPEGTLILDPSTNTLNIALGKAFDDADPAAIFAAVSPDVTEAEVKVKTNKSKSKSKVRFYTANKVVATTANTNTSVNTTTEQPQQ
jgi:hypothetical protein